MERLQLFETIRNVFCSLQDNPVGKHEWYRVIGRESGTDVNYGPLCIHVSHYMSNVRMQGTTQ